MDLNNLILFFILISFSLLFYKYFVPFLNKYNSKLLVDNQFKKPQSFHKLPTSTSGGTGIFFSFLILNLYLFLSKEIIYYEYLSFCSLFFILGLSDDLKLNLEPKFRLIAMILLLISLIICFKIVFSFFFHHTNSFIHKSIPVFSSFEDPDTDTITTVIYRF